MGRQAPAAPRVRDSRIDSAASPNTLDYRFKVQNNPIRAGEPGNVISVTYSGIVPDTFKGEAEVVLQGTLTPKGFTPTPTA